MYKVKGKPWAYSGAIDVSDCATAKEVMLKAGLNFNVAKCELVGKMPMMDCSGWSMMRPVSLRTARRRSCSTVTLLRRSLP